MAPTRIRIRFRRPAPELRWPESVDSDARPVEREERGAGPGPDPEVERRRRFRSGVVLFVLGLIFLAGLANALLGDRGYLEVRRSRAELEALERQVNERFAQVMELKRQVEHLQTDPRALERFAREELNYGKPGEIQFLLPPDSQSSGAATPPP